MRRYIILSLTVLGCYGNIACAEESRFYVKASAGYAQNNQRVYEISNPSYTYIKASRGAIGALGFGINIGKGFRSDLEYIAHDGLQGKSSFEDVTPSINFKIKSRAQLTLLNLRYDILGSITKMTPFMTIGAGYGWTLYDIKTNSTSRTADHEKARSQGFAYQGGIGLSYQLDAALLEIEFRYLNTGAQSKNSKNNTYRFLKKSARIQGLFAGVRYPF